MNFTIDPAFLTDVTVTKTYRPHRDKTDLTAEELLDVIKYSHASTIMRTEDHPEFARLRNQLESKGYIQCERSWWNGDRVVKSFTLNGVAFETGDQFPCAVAMSGHLKFKHTYRADNPIGDGTGLENRRGLTAPWEFDSPSARQNHV